MESQLELNKQMGFPNCRAKHDITKGIVPQLFFRASLIINVKSGVDGLL